MAQTDFLFRETCTWLGPSASFGVRAGATLYRLECEQNLPLATGLTEGRLGIPDEQQIRYSNPKRIRGLKIASTWGPLKVLLKGIPSAAKLGATGTVTTLSQRPFFKHGFGREYAQLGCTVGVGSTATALVVDDTSLRQAGELIAVEITAGVWQITKVLQVVDATHMTLAYGLSSAPATTRGVRGLYGYYCPETRTDSLVIEQAFVGNGTTANEYRALGCYGDLKWEFPNWGEIPRISLQGGCTDWEGPTTLTSPAFGNFEPADDDMDPAMPWVPVVYLATSVLRASTPAYRIEKCSFEFMSGWDQIPDSSKPQPVGGVIDTGGREGDVFGKLNLTIRADPDELANFIARTERECLITSSAQDLSSIAAWEFPRAYLVSPPKPVSLGKGRGGAELSFELLYDNTCTLPGSPTVEQKDLARSPMRFGLM